jgi:uncharacterized metal-binding protein YceD (DUF177 family)
MPITFNLRHLEKRELRLVGEVPASELDLVDADEMIQVNEPVRYDLLLERLSDSVLVQGQLHCTLSCQCVRCLRPFTFELELKPWTRDLALTGEERVPVSNDCVDLTPYVREDTLLAFPQHPLCEADCPGLRETGGDSNESASVERPVSEASSAWAELNKLKF